MTNQLSEQQPTRRSTRQTTVTNYDDHTIAQGDQEEPEASHQPVEALGNDTSTRPEDRASLHG